jgi:hypothetical protein
MNQAKDTAGYMGQSLGSTSHRGFSAYDDDDDLQHEEGEGDKRGRWMGEWLGGGREGGREGVSAGACANSRPETGDGYRFSLIML